MVGAAVSHLSPTFSLVPKYSLKPLLFSTLSTSVPSKSTRRKNYLRPKMLKTIPKPLLSSTPSCPITSTEYPPETKTTNVVVFERPSDIMPTQVLEKTDKVEDFQVSETSTSCVIGENSGNIGRLSASTVLKLGFYFVAVSMFQTLIAVWVIGNGVSQDKDGNFDSLQSNNDSKNGWFIKNGKDGPGSRNVFYWNDSKFEEKVEEIRVMAREARKTEKKGVKSNGDEEDDMTDESLNSKAKIGIEKEIGARLSKLEKKLNSNRENFPGPYMKFLDKLDCEDVKDMNETLFINKFKFRGPQKNSGSSNKGFTGLKVGGAPSNKNGIATSGSKASEVDDGKSVLSQNSGLLPSNREKTEEEEFRAVRDNKSAGSESTQERLSTEVMESRKSRDLNNTQNMKKFPNENQQSRSKSDKQAFLHTSKSRDVSNKPPANIVEDNQSDIKNDPWWLNLPYVLAILMRRGVDREGRRGHFTLKISSEHQEQSKTSCTVAFEDHNDANNFCYLLECFFEDLGDFSAQVVPMSAKELFGSIKSNAKKVIVVKKGQLKLYEGQPFAEVELALWSLIKDNQIASIADSE